MVTFYILKSFLFLLFADNAGTDTKVIVFSGLRSSVRDIVALLGIFELTFNIF